MQLFSPHSLCSRRCVTICFDERRAASNWHAPGDYEMEKGGLRMYWCSAHCSWSPVCRLRPSIETAAARGECARVWIKGRGRHISKM